MTEEQIKQKALVTDEERIRIIKECFEGKLIPFGVFNLTNQLLLFQRDKAWELALKEKGKGGIMEVRNEKGLAQMLVDQSVFLGEDISFEEAVWTVREILARELEVIEPNSVKK